MTPHPLYRIEELSPTFGARVAVLDLRQEIDQPIADGLVEALYRYRMLMLPGQDLDHTSHVRFSRWNVGDLVIWDNHATMHTRTPCDHEAPSRLLYRTTVI